MTGISRLIGVNTALAVLGVALSAPAFGGVYVGKTATEPLVAHSAHIVVMKRGERSVVTVAPDYDGPLSPFAMVLAVPSDVTQERVITVKREFIDRLEHLTAPRFHEFWEMDPCQSGPPQQIWERSKKANAKTAFLGGGSMMPGTGKKKVAKELFIKVDAEVKNGEYTLHVLDDEQSQDLGGFLSTKGYALGEEAKANCRTIR